MSPAGCLKTGPQYTLIIHARNEVEWEDAAARVRAAITVAATPPQLPGPIVIERIERWP